MMLLISLAVCGALALCLLFGFTSWYKQQPVRAVFLITGGLFFFQYWIMVVVSSVVQAILNGVPLQ